MVFRWIFNRAGWRFLDCLLQPVCVIPDPDRFGGNDNSYVVLNLMEPHESNGRALIKDDDDFVGLSKNTLRLTLKQTYLLVFQNGYPGPQGPITHQSVQITQKVVILSMNTCICVLKLVLM